MPRLRPLWALCRIVGVRPRNLRIDRTRHGWHVVLTLNVRLSRGELVAFQACAGSDLRREALNLMRVIAIRRTRIRGFWSHRWNLLFTEKLK